MPPIPSRILSYRSHRLWKMLPPAARISSTERGKPILNMLHNAANLAEANSQHALDVAQKLSHQLRAAEARIAELESEGQSYQERAERAEQWLQYKLQRDRGSISETGYSTRGGHRHAAAQRLISGRLPRAQAQ